MTVQLAQHNGRIYLRAPFNEDLIDDLKFRFPLRRRGWDPDRRLWWVDEREADSLLTLMAWHQADVRHVPFDAIAVNNRKISGVKP